MHNGQRPFSIHYTLVNGIYSGVMKISRRKLFKYVFTKYGFW